jgi:transcriptional regulator GlxA family with amidase domain
MGGLRKWLPWSKRLQQPIEILFVLLPDTLLLDWAGPAEAFRMANASYVSRAEQPRFVLRFMGPRSSAVSSVGALISGLEPLPASLPAGSWVVLSGSPSVPAHASAAANKETVKWLARVRPGNNDTRLITICSGAVLAARAGLLKDRSATTHHQHLDELSEVESQCRVVSNRVFVNDGSIWSSAGVTTGVDLALHLIALECGPTLAARIAQTMVLGVRRSGNDPQLSPLLAHRNHLHPAVHRVQDAVSEQPTRDWTLERMAQVAHTSSRHLTRLFIEQTGATPLQYLRTVRVALAEMSLRAGHSVTRAAELAGFRSDTQLRRAWRGLGQHATPSAIIRQASMTATASR